MPDDAGLFTLLLTTHGGTVWHPGTTWPTRALLLAECVEFEWRDDLGTPLPIDGCPWIAARIIPVADLPADALHTTPDFPGTFEQHPMALNWIRPGDLDAIEAERVKIRDLLNVTEVATLQRMADALDVPGRKTMAKAILVNAVASFFRLATACHSAVVRARAKK